MTRVYIVDDHEDMRTVLQLYLDRQPDIEICGTAATGGEALDRLAASGADVALVDLSLPDMSGIDLIREVTRRHPEVRLLVLSGHRSRGHVDAAFAAGARGYVLKDDATDVPRGVREVLDGGSYVSPSIRAHIDRNNR